MIIKLEKKALIIKENERELIKENISEIFSKNIDKSKGFVNLSGCEGYISEKLKNFDEYNVLTETEKDKISKEIFEVLSNY